MPRFKKVLITRNLDFINNGIKFELISFGIKQIDYV